MTGVYISEVCLIGLFAINTAPGPIVLMGVFLVFTAIYHAMIRDALKPLTQYLPDSLDGDSQVAHFAHADIHSYDAKKNSLPPSDAQTVHPKRFGAWKANIYARIFDPQNFKSNQSVASLLPNYPSPSYGEGDEDRAYFNPAVTALRPIIWIVRDPMGISRQEVRDSSQVVQISDEFARFDEKNKIVWDEDRLENVPIYEKRVDY
jgi:calcium permeable stress-gated cation channel